MATAVLTERVHPDQRVLGVCGLGPFGARVASTLSDLLPGVAVADSVRAAFDGPPDVVILVSWRPSAAEFDRADELAYTHQVPWLPVTLEHPVLRVGPWVDPLSGPCHRCYRSRTAQHDRQFATSRVLHAAYDNDPTLGHRGFLPGHVRVAANFVALLLRGDPPAGQVFTVGLSETRVKMSRVVPVHGCPHCGRRDVVPSGLAATLGWAHDR
jgi:bacteriocin biosynthesis cyclodehydratase domain-containing protein